MARLLLAVVFGALLAWGLQLDTWLARRHDWQMTWLAPAPPADAALVVDVDEASIRHLGAWPLRRDAYVPAGQWLLDAGARALVFGMLLVDAREGDEAFGRWLAGAHVPVLLGARSLVGDGETGPAQPAPAGCRARAWPAWQLPVWARPGEAPAPLPISRVGVLSVPVDEDNLLRRLPLWQQAGALTLPVLPLAAWRALHPDAGALHCEGGAGGAVALAGAGQARWPLDAEHRVQPWLARPDPARPALPLAMLADAAAGRLPPDQARALAQQVSGRVVFIGSSAALGDEVLTPGGPRSATALLAGTYDALAQGRVMAPMPAWSGAVLLLVGLLPALVIGLRRRPAAAADLAWIAGAAVLLLVLDTALLAWGRQLAPIGWPLATLGVLALLTLRHAQRQAQAERDRLRRERAEAEAASRVKSDFLAHVSHEIRTPLHALLGAADLLAASPLDATQARHVALFQGAGQELLLMLGDVLDLSKAEAGLLPLAPQPFSLPRLVAAQVLMFEARAAQKGLALQVDADPDLPDTVIGDAGRLAQVLRNLLSNALKFTSVGGVTLAVHRVAGGARLRFEVRDTGIGLPADRAARLFEPYVQADASVSQQYGGTGLGLAISRRLVEAMGGQIGVRSREGLGATFAFELPLPATAAPAVPAPVGTSVLPGAGQGRGARLAGMAGRWAGSASTRPLRLLLADDNPHALLLAQAYLDGAVPAPGAPALQVDTVHDGAAAVRRFEAAPYDIVLMDLHMPVLDGHAAARAMREAERRRRVRQPALLVALSGDSGAADRVAAHEAGFDVHLGKPCTRAQLLPALGLQAAGRGQPPVAVAGPPTEAGAPVLDRISQLPDSNVDEALDRLGSPQLYGQVLAAASMPLRQFERSLSQALDSVPCNLDQAHRLAHDLKSIAATLGLPGLAADARRLEQLLAETTTPSEDLRLAAARQAVAQRLAGVQDVLAGMAALPPSGPAR